MKQKCFEIQPLKIFNMHNCTLNNVFLVFWGLKSSQMKKGLKFQMLKDPKVQKTTGLLMHKSISTKTQNILRFTLHYVTHYTACLTLVRIRAKFLQCLLNAQRPIHQTSKTLFFLLWIPSKIHLNNRQVIKLNISQKGYKIRQKQL